MRTNKVAAAKRLAASLVTDFDFEGFLMDHPNTEKALDRLLDDVLSSEPKKVKEEHMSNKKVDPYGT